MDKRPRSWSAKCVASKEQTVLCAQAGSESASHLEASGEVPWTMQFGP